jgi:uncharacterized membrane protein
MAVDAYLVDWLDLAFRFLHVIAAIVWIGTSFYFVALDNHLRPPADDRDAGRGVGGESWEIHGGGFYRIEKFRVAPATIPEPLHWYKWEAYTTWLAGFALFVSLYYLQPRTYLIDPSVADVSPAAAVAASIALLVVAWLVYDLLCRTVGARSDVVLGACMTALVAVTAYGVTKLLAPRAAYLQVGAMLGTIMVANVFFVIIPAHWELVRAKAAGRDPDPAANARGKQRSVHNNYLTLPVLLAMLSNHFAFLYTSSHAWIVLVLLMAIGAGLRHFFNLRHRGRDVWAIPVAGALALAGIAIWLRPSVPSSAAGAPVPFARVRAIVSERCAPCHSSHPTQAGFSSPPLGIAFDTPSEIVARAAQIEQQAVVLKAMPLGNVTHMTQAERDALGAWIRRGARTGAAKIR